ncbi:chitobiase/beta-hexosaminidase C-terminal domain-containing protein [Arhodomonas sp. AD133]|uniref:chitobiase/beta-hexosaminidase C-terminal domain-containing protein n=1 Tax=Arhodomonas sp. AD133 TaxID=3415009 RepID=UPI003EB94656
MGNFLNDADVHFALGSDIDLSSYSDWGPLGDDTNAFGGHFDGRGHAIGGLQIAPDPGPIPRQFVGLFARSTGAIENLTLASVAVNASSAYYVGSLVGRVEAGGSLRNVFVSGSVAGRGSVGGLAGESLGTIETSSADLRVSDFESHGGGLVGQLGANATAGHVIDSHATGAVTGGDTAGGLVGRVVEGSVTRSYATGRVTGSLTAGGLVAEIIAGTVSQSFATGTVDASYDVGGLVGINGGGVIQSYAVGDVTATQPRVGGLIGTNASGATVTESYSAGFVKGNEVKGDRGGLIGRNDASPGAVARSFWDTTASGYTTSAGGTGEATGAMADRAIYDAAGWDDTVWSWVDGRYPALKAITYDDGLDWAAPAAPAADPLGGLYNADQTVTLTGEAGASLYFTRDGTAPSPASNAYTGPITVTATTTVKAIAVDTAGNQSEVLSETYTIDKTAPAKPTVDLPGGIYSSDQSVTLSGESGTSLYYTLDGTAPTSSSTLYSSPITITDSTTLNAIAVDAAGNASGVRTATYTIEKGFAGGDGSAADPWRIATPEQLNHVRTYVGNAHAGRHFRLVNDIDLAAYLAPGGAGYAQWGDAGWRPIGDSGTSAFAGVFDGNGHVISGLVIDRPSRDHAGLFGAVSGEITDVGIASATLTARSRAGALAGTIAGTGALVSQAWASGTINTADGYAGGLVGHLDRGALERSFSTASVSGSNYVGGLIGRTTSHASGSTIDRAAVRNAYSTGDVSGERYVGGLAGANDGALQRTYSTGHVNGDTDTGGLIGSHDSFAQYDGTSFWNTGTSGLATSSGGAPVMGIETAAMRRAATFSGWDFPATWRIIEAGSFPTLTDTPQDPLPGLVAPDTDNILYVDENVNSTTQGGGSWSEAIPELADALRWARARHDSGEGWDRSNPLRIHVAASRYEPHYRAADSTTDGNPTNARDNAFVLVPNVRIRGGFNPGDDVSVGLPATTTLSGDLGTRGEDSDNAYHVIVAAGDLGGARLDGVRITGGQANGSGAVSVDGHRIPRDAGGGLYLASSALPLSNVAITGNAARDDGGGIHTQAGSPAVVNATITANSVSGGHGGGIHIANGGTVSVTNTIVRGNRRGSGSPDNLYAAGSTLNVRHSLLEGDPGSWHWGMDRTGNDGGGNIITPVSPFADEAGGDVRLRPGSAAVFAGTPAPYRTGGAAEDVTTDVSGNPRRVDGYIDLGAHQSPGFVVSLDPDAQQAALGSAYAPIGVTVAARTDTGFDHPERYPLAGGSALVRYPTSGATATFGGAPGNPYALTLDGAGQAATPGAVASGNAGPFAVTVALNGADAATARMRNIDVHGVTAAVSGNGSITPAQQKVVHGGAATFDVVPDTGWQLVAVGGDTCDPVANGDGTWTAANITKDCAVEAAFTTIMHTVTASAGPNGTVTPDRRDAAHGATTSFTVTPERGYNANFGGDCPMGTQTGDRYTTGPITGDCQVAVTFMPSHPERVEVTGGDRQNAPPGEAFRTPLTVRVLDTEGQPLGGVTVTFRVVSGDATLSQRPRHAGSGFTLGLISTANAQAAGVTTVAVTTDTKGRAAVYATAGQGRGEVVVTAEVAGASAPARFTLRNAADTAPTAVPATGIPALAALSLLLWAAGAITTGRGPSATAARRRR